MEFLTLHELSVQLDISVRVLRHRLRQLLTEGKFVESRDCRRDDYVDATHFVWRVDPVAFTRATRLQPVNNRDNQAPSFATGTANQPTAPVSKPAETGGKTLPKVDTQPPGMEREMIDLLKDQVRVKDGQIVELTTQNKTLTGLNEKLTGAVVHQSEQIRNLLRLTGGKIDLSEMETKPAAEAGDPATQPDNKSATMGSDFGSHSVDMGNGQERTRAA